MANWYAYLGFGDPLNPANYRLSSIKPSCFVGEDLCAILLDQTNYIPCDIEPVDLYIKNALITQFPQSTGIGVKRFVYMRGVVS